MAVIEEFNAGEGTYLRNGEVVALRVGKATPNMKDRVINVKPAKIMNRVPRPGDIIMGVVETAQPSIMSILITSINGKDSQANFTGIIVPVFERGGGRGRVKRSTICKPGDLIRAHVFSTLNANLHLAVDRPDEGVIYTVCSVCGGGVARIRDRVKCIECGNVEERKLAADFVGDRHRLR